MEFLPVEVIDETPRAIKVWFAGRGCSRWIPRSQRRPGSVLHLSDCGKLVVEGWLGQALIEELGLEELTYDDGYTDGVQDGYRNGYRAGYDAGAARAHKSNLTGARDVYRKLMLKWHPDNGGDSDVAKDINELWQAIRAVSNRKG